MGSIADFLEQTKSGYSKWVSVFDDVGCDDTDDVPGIVSSAKAMAELESGLTAAGAKTGHVLKIKGAMEKLAAASLWF